MTTQDLVQHYTGLGRDELSMLVFESAYDYLEQFRVPGVVGWIEEMTATRHWWVWWRRQWEARDRRWLEACGMTTAQPVLPNQRRLARQSYLEWHDPVTLPERLSGRDADRVFDEMDRNRRTDRKRQTA